MRDPVSLSGAFRAWLLTPVIDFLTHMRRELAVTNDELVQRLTSVESTLDSIFTEVEKISDETGGLQTEIQALKAEIAAGGGSSPEVDALIAAIEGRASAIATSVAALDQQVPDEEPPPAAA